MIEPDPTESGVGEGDPTTFKAVSASNTSVTDASVTDTSRTPWPASRPDAQTFLPLTPAVFHILLALADADRHGYGIAKEVAARTDDQMRLGPGTLYGTLTRMVEAGLVEERPRQGRGPPPTNGAATTGSPLSAGTSPVRRRGVWPRSWTWRAQRRSSRGSGSVTHSGIPIGATPPALSPDSWRPPIRAGPVIAVRSPTFSRAPSTMPGRARGLAGALEWAAHDVRRSRRHVAAAETRRHSPSVPPRLARTCTRLQGARSWIAGSPNSATRCACSRARPASPSSRS